jgi:cobyrinic acid a,c-diamide synthase
MAADTRLRELPPIVSFAEVVKERPQKVLSGQRIAVARDAAFSFVYRANLDLLAAMGAELAYFSPLEDVSLPVADSLYLPGGYPELYLDKLSANRELHKAIRAHYDLGKPIVAECGGMLYLLESLTDINNHSAQMVGIIAASASMQKRLGGLGLQAAALSEGDLRGHTFHYSTFDAPPAFDGMAQCYPYERLGEGIIRSKGLLAAYIHWYFPSNPEAAARLFLSSTPATEVLP